MSTVVNPLTGRRIKRSGRTAKIPAVSARLQGTTVRPTKRTGCGGFELCHGSKQQVWNGTAMKTVGGVTRSGLFQDKNGRIRFASRSKAAKRNPDFMARAALVKAQYSSRR
jgi:hypothetical protein